MADFAPLFPSKPGDPIRSDSWNQLQVRLLQEIAKQIAGHAHLGSDGSRQIGGDAIDIGSAITSKQLLVTDKLTVGTTDVAATLTQLAQQLVAQISSHVHTGGAQGLKLTGDAIDPAASLTVNTVSATGLSTRTLAAADQLTVGSTDVAATLTQLAQQLVAQISSHVHTGGAQGHKLTGDAIDPAANLTVNSLGASSVSTGTLSAATTLSVAGISVGDLLNQHSTQLGQLLPLTGGNLTNSLSIANALSIGAPVGDRRLTVENGELKVHASHNNPTPDIAAFYAQNMSQGVGIGFNSICALGANPNQDLNLVPRGSGALQLQGPTNVNGGLLTANQGATVNGGLLTANAGLTVNAAVLTANAGLTVNGPLTVNGGPLIATTVVTPAGGNLTLSAGWNVAPQSSSYLNDGGLYLRSSAGGGDHNHGISYGMPVGRTCFGNNIDGAILFGNTGGGLGTMNNGQRLALTWDANNAVVAKGDVRVSGIMTGPPADYQNTQFTLTGGGTILWGGPGQRLCWSNRFIAVGMEKGITFPTGSINISFPYGMGMVLQAWDNAARQCDTGGVVLYTWEALWFVHTPGTPPNSAPVFRITRNDTAQNLVVPSNWILLAVVNGDDGSLRLGTGATIPAGRTFNAAQPLRVIQLLNQQTGALPKNVPFTSYGSSLLLFASGSGYSSSAGVVIGMTIVIDGIARGQATCCANQTGMHLPFTANALLIPGIPVGPYPGVGTGPFPPPMAAAGGPAAPLPSPSPPPPVPTVQPLPMGNHNLMLAPFGPVVADVNDFFTVTIIELPS